MAARTITLWMEGYAATGEHATAQYCGTYTATDLNDAVRQWVAQDPADRTSCTQYGPSPSFWGCRFFESEEAARASFG